MSYIRSTSNPEKLYVWGDVDGYTYFALGCILKAIYWQRKIPNDVWEKFLEWWRIEEAEELWYCDDGFTFCYKDVRLTVLNYDPKHDYKVYFHYKDSEREWDMELWPVTWYYMMPNQPSRFGRVANVLEHYWMRLQGLVEDGWWWFKETILEIE